MKIIFAIFLFLIGCSKKEVENLPLKVEKETIFDEAIFNNYKNNGTISNSDLKKVEIKCEFEINFRERNFGGELNIFTKSPDSMLINVTGPFNMNVGSVLISNNKAKIFNNIEGSTRDVNLEQIERFSFIPSNQLISFFGLTKNNSNSIELPDSASQIENKIAFWFLNNRSTRKMTFDTTSKFLLSDEINLNRNSISLNYSSDSSGQIPKSLIIRNNETNEKILEIFVSNYNIAPSFESIKNLMPDESGYSEK